MAVRAKDDDKKEPRSQMPWSRRAIFLSTARRRGLRRGLTGRLDGGTLRAMSVVIPDSAILALASGASICRSACSPGPISVGDDRFISDSSGTGGGAGGAARWTRRARFDVADAIAPTPGGLVGVTSSCIQISTGLLASRPGATPDVPICGLGTAVFWTSGLAVLCSERARRRATRRPILSSSRRRRRRTRWAAPSMPLLCRMSKCRRSR